MAKNQKDPVGNIFDLTQIGAASTDIQVDAAVPKLDQAALLDGYELVDPENWDSLENGTLARYLRQDGEFRRGGHIISIDHVTDTDGKPTIRFDFVSNYGPNCIKWSVFKGSISKIWIKISSAKSKFQENEKNSSRFTELKQDLKNCKDAIETLNKEVQKINNEQMRTVLLIKKLHDIK